jgi:hypothetical protein
LTAEGRTRLGLFGFSASEFLCLLFLANVVVVAIVLSKRGGRAATPPRTDTDDPLGRIKQDYEALTDRERRELLEFVERDLRRPEATDLQPPPPAGGYAP